MKFKIDVLSQQSVYNSEVEADRLCFSDGIVYLLDASGKKVAVYPADRLMRIEKTD